MVAAGSCATERRKPSAGSRRHPKSRLRLTRRGRVVVSGAAALLVTGVMAVASLQVGAGTAQATSAAAEGPGQSSAAAEGLGQSSTAAEGLGQSSTAISRHAAERNLRQMTVLPGQSLWSVAETADPDADTRVVIQQIIEFNALTGTVVQPGERLWVPRD